MTRSALLSALLSLALLLPAARDAGAASPQLVGFIAVSGASEAARVDWACLGTPVCTGEYRQYGQIPGCSNGFWFSGSFVMSGVDVSRIGSFSGTITTSGGVFYDQNADGTCTFTANNAAAFFPYTASWDGHSGSITFLSGDPTLTLVTGFTFSVAAPLFPMNVTSTITPDTASATAQLQPRPQDVGRVASVFIFAHAPASLVRGTKRVAPSPSKLGPADAGPDPCVLAQLTAAGELVAVSPSDLVATATGVLTASQQSATLLNNTPTQNVVGTTFFVGYGANAASMFSSGVYQGAVLVPPPEGGVAQPAGCAETLGNAPAAQSPGALSGLWYKESESGWGIHFTQRRNVLFAAWYTYDDTGKPKWYVADSCAMPPGVTGTVGTCTGTLYEVTGPPFFGTAFQAAPVRGVPTGSLQVAFSDANHASMSYTAAGQSRTVSITRQIFRASGAPPAIDYTDLWYQPSASGWGLAVSHQFGTMFLAWFVYEAQGKPTWYVVSNCEVSGNGCTGTVYRTSGPPFGPTFDPNAVHGDPVGNANLGFTDSNNGFLTFSVQGAGAGTWAITRQTF
jgi:hypothetical protein